MTRAEAKAKGLKRYFTGVPCKRGHLAERSTGRGCIECSRLRDRMLHANNPEYRQRKKEQAHTRHVKKYADPEYRERQKQRSFRNYTIQRDNPEYLRHRKEVARAWRIKRIANDPEYRQREAEYARRWRIKRIANDPEYRMKTIEARKLGLRKYVPDVPCEKCGTSMYYVNGHCVVCTLARLKTPEQKAKERLRRSGTEWNRFRREKYRQGIWSREPGPQPRARPPRPKTRAPPTLEELARRKEKQEEKQQRTLEALVRRKERQQRRMDERKELKRRARVFRKALEELKINMEELIC